MFVVQDLSEVVYGGAVTFGEWWDSKRITEGKITDKDVLKKAGFHIYLWPGLIAAVANAMGAFRNRPGMPIVMEKLSTAFLFFLPMEIYHAAKSLKAAGSNSLAIREAQQILRQRQAINPAAAARRVSYDVQNPTEILV